MKRPAKTILFLTLFGFVAMLEAMDRAPQKASGRLEDFKPAPTGEAAIPPILTEGRFSGYTNYWHSIYWKTYQYGNLFQLSHPDVERSIAQNKADIAEELGIAGLILKEGFLSGLIEAPYQELEQPTLAAVETALKDSPKNLLLFTALSSEAGRALARKTPDDARRKSLISHQFKAIDFHEVKAFCLENGPRKIFVAASDCAECLVRLRLLIHQVEDIDHRYDLHRGWFAAGTLLHSVTCFPGHPLEVIAQGLNQGNDWFTFNGYMDYLLQSQLPEWLAKVGLDIVTDVGTARATRSLGTLGFGCTSWDGLKIQDTPGEADWLKFVKERGGYVFRPVFSAECDAFKYDGYIAVEGNKKQIDSEHVPFILPTGFIREDAPPCMVLFTEKNAPLTRERMWQAILDRREVGILPQAKMLGPREFREALQMLLLDRVYLEDYFGDQVQLEAVVEGGELRLKMANVRGRALAGSLMITAAPELRIGQDYPKNLSLPANSTRTLAVKVRPNPAAMGKVNPLLIEYRWGTRKKRTLAILDLPRAISAHQLLYGQAPEIEYPVSIHNFTDRADYAVELGVFKNDELAKPVLVTSRRGGAGSGGFEEMNFRLRLDPGAYKVRVRALGAENWSQLGVEAASGSPRAYAVDLNKDGLDEYRLENDRVRVTLLAIGARVIEYIVREKNDNIFFKLWPEKEVATDKRPFRERGFYPYGGFEDFLGQASMETHKVYEAEIVKASGPYVQVRMTADYYGNKLEKIFTLYGGSPLVEVRFALTFRNPEANMLGPQPILELGKRHWTEDLFIVPGRNGLEEFRMRPEEYFGRLIFLKEGWNAGYDTEEDIGFVGAFPVSEPEFLHMWMNHPSNGESNHYYAEFQPWVPIYQKTVRYFTYYLWGAAGSWKNGLEELRKRNLITSR